MINLVGQTFISYKSEQKAVATALKKSLHEHGIRTWQDNDDLGTEPTDAELREVIRSNSITDAVIVVSEKVGESDTILDVEIPEIVEKDHRNDDFGFVVALCPNLNTSKDQHQNEEEISETSENERKSIYEEAADILDNADTNFGHFPTRNMKKITEEGVNPNDCDKVASAVLENRLSYVDRNLPEDDSLQCSLDTYPVTHPKEPIIKMDWTHRFGETLPSEPVWNGRFVPILDSVIKTIYSIMPERRLIFQGKAKLSAAFSLGFITRKVTGVTASWMQGKRYSGEEEIWDISTDPSKTDVQINRDFGYTSNSDGAAMISISEDVDKVSARESDYPKFGPSIELKSKNYSANIDSSQASGIARKVEDLMKELSQEHRNLEKIHFLIASPIGLAFIIGQVTNALPDIQTYVLETSEGPKRYKRAALLSNSH